MKSTWLSRGQFHQHFINSFLCKKCNCGFYVLTVWVSYFLAKGKAVGCCVKLTTYIQIKFFVHITQNDINAIIKLEFPNLNFVTSFEIAKLYSTDMTDINSSVWFLHIGWNSIQIDMALGAMQIICDTFLTLFRLRPPPCNFN